MRMMETISTHECEILHISHMRALLTRKPQMGRYFVLDRKFLSICNSTCKGRVALETGDIGRHSSPVSLWALVGTTQPRYQRLVSQQTGSTYLNNENERRRSMRIDDLQDTIASASHYIR